MRTADVFRHFGNNEAAVARALGIGRAAVNKWGTLVPPIRAHQLHSITSGKLVFEAAPYQRIPRWAQLAAALAGAPTKACA